MRQLVIDRRTFLKAAGLTAAGAGGARQVMAAQRPGVEPDAPFTQLSEDPIAAQADSLDYDEERIFRFVADEISYEPYAGMLRGPRATLAGRAGNAADKAALLAALLNAALIDTRFVVGTLDGDVAAMLASTLVDRDAARARAAGVASRGSSDGAAPDGVLSPEVRAIIDRLPEIDEAVTAWASASVDGSVRTIVDALSAAGIPLPSGTAPLPDLERTRHVWVQSAHGTDWTDLDPTLAGSEAGTIIARPTGDPVAAIPDDLRHRVDIDLIAEVIGTNGLEQEALIEHALFADELTDVPLAIGHAKPEALKGVGVAIDRIVTGGVRYQAILQVDQTAIVGVTGLRVAGEDGGPLGGDATDRVGEATAEWLEVRVTSPGRPIAVARRTLFDRVDGAARLAGAVDPASIQPAGLVDLGPDGADEYLPMRTVNFLSVATGASDAPALAGLTTDEERSAAALGIGAPMYHVARDAANAALALRRGVAIHLDTPNIVMRSHTPHLEADGTVSIADGLDLLHRGFATSPVAGIAAQVPAGVLAGVTSHVAERLRTGEGLPTDLAPATQAVSVGAIMERAAAEGVGLRVLQGAIPTDADYQPAALAHLSEALVEGWVAIVPERSVTLGGEDRLGWWLVDATTGATIDMLDDGRGAVTMEEGLLLIAAGMIFMFEIFALGLCLRLAFDAVSQAMRGSVGGSVLDVPVGKFLCGAG